MICLGGLPLDDPGAASDQLHTLCELGVTRFICGGGRYTTVDEFKQLVDGTTAVRAALD